MFCAIAISICVVNSGYCNELQEASCGKFKSYAQGYSHPE